MKAPVSEKFAPELNVNVPLLVIVTGPVPVVVTVLAKVKVVPLRSMPAAPLVARAPLNAVVPVPAVWATDAAVKEELAVTFAALTIVTAPSGFPPPPTAPVKVTFPVPAVRSRVCAATA